MRLFAIDPGYTQSAWVEYANGLPATFGIDRNGAVLDLIRETSADRLVIESVASYGMPVGAEVFETVLWSGRFIQRWLDVWGYKRSPVQRIYRRDVKLHLCGTSTAKDANVRQALIDRYGPGKAAAIGLKKAPGPLYGVSKDVWAALAVAVTAVDAIEREGMVAA